MLEHVPSASVAFTGFAYLLQVLKQSLRKIQCRPGLTDGCPAGTGLCLEPGDRHHEVKIV